MMFNTKYNGILPKPEIIEDGKEYWNGNIVILVIAIIIGFICFKKYTDFSFAALVLLVLSSIHRNVTQTQRNLQPFLYNLVL